MRETAQILALFKDLYNGDDTFLDVTLVGVIGNVTAENAAKKPSGANSIWEITNHLIAWRENVLQRVSGTVIITPEHNYFIPISDTSQAAWHQTFELLKLSQQKWEDFLGSFSDEQLASVYQRNGLTHYQHIHSIIQHDAYHLGQIVLIAKHLV
jgi:uncharacterized damage-inducible protein DinB